MFQGQSVRMAYRMVAMKYQMIFQVTSIDVFEICILEHRREPLREEHVDGVRRVDLQGQHN